MKNTIRAIFVLLAIFIGLSAAAQTMIVDAPNVYSPHMQKMVDGHLKMYYGEQIDGRDVIRRADCTTPTACTLEHTVMFRQPGTGGVILTEHPDGMVHVNDPAVIDTGEILILYFTACVDVTRCIGSDRSGNEIWWSISARDGGLNWSPPTRLLFDAWSPSVVRDFYGDLILYANVASTGELFSMNMGPYGNRTAPQRHVTVNNARRYQNVEVRYYAPLQLWIMVGEGIGLGEIDALISTDGYVFQLAIGRLAGPVGDWAYVRTPAMLPDSICWLYAAATKDVRYSAGNKIFAQSLCGG